MAETLDRGLLTELRRPFTAEAAKFKVQSNLSGDRGLIVAYLDARLVSERLNLLAGGEWEDSYRHWGERIDSGLLWCDLTVRGVTRTDVGQGSGKAGVSDAFKRAAVRFGIGVPFYATPQQYLPSSQNGDSIDAHGKPHLRRVKRGDKTLLYLTADCDRWLRERYREWLDQVGIEAFGEALDHGDVAGSTGDPTEDATAVPGEASDLTELSAKRQEALVVYADTTRDSPTMKRNLPIGRLKGQLESAETVAEVEELIERVRNMKGEV